MKPIDKIMSRPNPPELHREYLSIKDICIIMGYSVSKARLLMMEFHAAKKVIKHGRTYRLHIDYFNEWRDQMDGSISRFKQPLKPLKGGKE